MPNLQLSRLAAVVLVIASLSSNLAAQQPVKDAPAPVDLGAFTKEIMALELRGGHSHLAMWLPHEFFVAATLSQKNEPKATVEKNLAFLVPYVPLFVQSSIQQPNGPDLYADEKEVRARAFLRLSAARHRIENNPSKRSPRPRKFPACPRRSQSIFPIPNRLYRSFRVRRGLRRFRF